MLHFELLLLPIILFLFLFKYSNGLDCNINCSSNLTVNNKLYFNNVLNCFDNNNYDTKLISLPMLQSKDNSPFKIYYSFTLIDMLEFSSDGAMTLIIQLFIKWIDYNHCWDESIFPIELVSVPLINNQNKHIWFPKFELLNSRSGDIAFIVPNDKTEARIYSNGTVEMFLNTQIEAQCKVNLYLFPFDTQLCSLYFQLAQYNN